MGKGAYFAMEKFADFYFFRLAYDTIKISMYERWNGA